MYQLAILPLVSFGKGLIDNVFRDMIDKPAKGSVVYCDLAGGFAEHSGIYAGKNKIVHLNGNGMIEAVSPREFMNRLDGYNTAITIYTSCYEKSPTGSNAISRRAKSCMNQFRDYHVLFNNCHRFTSWCIAGDDSKQSLTLSSVKKNAKLYLFTTEWRAWNYQ
jgi:hypothetical protein